PSIMRTALAAALELPESRLRIVTPDVGGGFGLKMQIFPEDVAVAALARRLGRPVKWIEERRENLGAASQARAQRTSVEIAAAAAGAISSRARRIRSRRRAASCTTAATTRKPSSKLWPWSTTTRCEPLSDRPARRGD